MLSDRYQLGEVLGHGRVSVIFHGRDIRLEREVAIKLLRADFARDKAFRQHFLHAAQRSANLKHLAIVAVYDTDEAPSANGPLPYIVMEYVAGCSLRAILEAHGPLEPVPAMKIMADVCSALDFAHHHSVLHLDLKPATVLISRTGAVKVTDFGIAAEAPGKPADARSDVYAAGCLLHELLTGVPPSTGGPPRGDLRPPSKRNPKITPALDVVVLKALATKPANRCQSAAAMRADLLRIFTDQRPAAPKEMAEDNRTLWVFEPFADDQVATIPTISGQPYATAQSALRRAGFDDVVQESVPCWSTEYGKQPPCTADKHGTVLRTKPAQGIHVAVSTRIVMFVGQGPAKHSMPSLINRDRTDVDKIDAQMNLHRDRTVTLVKNNDPAKAGTVAAQNPEPGATVAEGDVVTLKVYAEPKIVQVTDYTGKQYGIAEAGLSAAGLNVVRQDVDSARPQGEVVNQDPSSGEAIAGTDAAIARLHAPVSVACPRKDGSPASQRGDAGDPQAPRVGTAVPGHETGNTKGRSSVAKLRTFLTGTRSGSASRAVIPRLVRTGAGSRHSLCAPPARHQSNTSTRRFQ